MVEEGLQGMTAQIITGLIVGVAVAAASSLVSHFLIRGRERERWEREERRQREEWDRETQAQHRADRLALYRQFLADVPRMGLGSDHEWAAWHRAEQAWAEIKLLGSKEVREAADHLFNVSSLKADAENTVRSNSALRQG
jgi:hypothetical protein